MDTAQVPNEPTAPQMKTHPQINKRPLSVTLLALVVLIITVINLVRFGLSIRDWSFLTSRLGVSPFYLAMTGLIWSAAGLVLLWGLWKAKKWAPKLMQAVGLTYALYYWLDHIFLMDHPISTVTDTLRASLFAAGVTLVCLAFMVWTLGREKVKSYFDTTDDVASINRTGKDEQG